MVGCRTAAPTTAARISVDVVVSLPSASTRLSVASVAGVVSAPVTSRSISSTRNVIGIKVGFRLKLDLSAFSVILWNIWLKERGNLLLGFQQGPGENTCNRLIAIGKERGCHSSMADAASTT